MTASDSKIGIDAGATLWKLVRLSREPLMELFPAGAVAPVRRRIAEWRSSATAAIGIGLSGGAAARIGRSLGAASIRRVSESEAWALGSPILAERAGLRLPARYLLVSLGTGTSILEVGPDGVWRRSGSPLGGGTLLGLARALHCADSFEQLTALARRGRRQRVDLLVRDVYPEGGIDLDPAFTASSFAKLDSTEPADLAAALMGLVGENVGILCAEVARTAALRTVVFGGTTLADNPVLERILEEAASAGGLEVRFLPAGAYCGALGAAVAYDRTT